MLLVLLVLSATARADWFYLAPAEIVEGRLISETDTQITIEVTGAGLRTVPRADVLAIEIDLTSQVPYVVTENDSDLLWQAAAAHKERARLLAQKAAAGDGDSAEISKNWRQANAWLERADACLTRYMTLFPERRTSAEKQMQEIKSLQELCHKNSRVDGH